MLRAIRMAVTPIASRFFVVFLFILLLTNLLTAQSYRGKILGTVTDPNGAVVPGAKVTGKNVGTQIERSTVTDTSGNYVLTELQIGTYEVKVEHSGFATYTMKHFRFRTPFIRTLVVYAKNNQMRPDTGT